MEEKDELGCIYLITNLVNNKQYVGQSGKKDCNVRYEKHWTVSKKGDKNYLLYNSMRSYRRECFKVESLCIVPKKSLNNMEMYWAEQLETYMWDNPGGYNMVWCGNQPTLGFKQSPELIKKRFAPLIGRKQGKEQIEKARNARNARIKSIIENGAKFMKLNDKQVLEIVKLVNLGEKSRTDIAKQFNVQPSVITRIMTGERWGHLTGIKFVPSMKKISKDLGIEKAREIRQIYAKGETTYEVLGILYGVKESTIASIIKNKNYKE